MERWPRCGTRDGIDKMSAHRKDGKPRKRNRYPAECNACGIALRPGDGVIEYSERDDRWSAFCAHPLSDY